MFVIIAVAVLILGIAFFQSVQGLFSSLIMALLTIACALLAFNYYEPLAGALLYTRQPAYADAGMLIALFVIPLLALRIAYDRFIGGNVLMGVWPDRIGGGGLGLITAMICVGVLMTALQMIPWGFSIMGYRPFSDSLQRKDTLAPFYPDEFTIWMVNGLSGGSLATDPEHTFAKTHDNLLLELACARNGSYDPKTGETLNGQIGAVPGGLTIVGAYQPADTDNSVKWSDDVPAYPIADAATKLSNRIVVVRCRVEESAAAADSDNSLRLAATQFRLVTAEGKSYYPVAYLTYSNGELTPAGWALHAPPMDKDGKADIAKLVVFRQARTASVDWVYRLPITDQPSYVAFRRVAVAEVPAIKKDAIPDTKGALDRKFDRR